MHARSAAVLLVLAVGCATAPSFRSTTADGGGRRPNIVWLVGEDASPHLGVYGEKVIATPRLDRLASEGVRFARAFVTAPVCSPSRSALITGMYQTTLGAHNHRSQQTSDKGEGGAPYHQSYRLGPHTPMVPQRLQQAGYFTVLGTHNWGKTGGPLAKSDYNFLWPADAFHGNDWAGRAPGQPFFAQIHLAGGKGRHPKLPAHVDPAAVVLPPYYPDHPVLRKDWAEYLDSWVAMDAHVGIVLDRLEAEGVADDTVVFFFTDHGTSHVRGKQFLYDEGIRIPLIVRHPGHIAAGSVRSDLVSHIDISATTLSLAGVTPSAQVQGRPLFDRKTPATHVFSARDRCDETVDIIRSVRTQRFKYIRNYVTQRGHAQPNEYKDAKAIMQAMRTLAGEHKLTPLQAQVFSSTRPPEELYDVEADPHETENLAQTAAHRATLLELRGVHEQFMDDSRDMGLIPEPELEELGARHGNKHAILEQADLRALLPRLREVIWAGEAATADLPRLRTALRNDAAAVRTWAAIGLHKRADVSALPQLATAQDDPSAAVRIAAALAVAMLDAGPRAPLDVLGRELASPNYAARLYAALAIEQLGERGQSLLPLLQATKGPDEVLRIAKRLAATR